MLSYTLQTNAQVPLTANVVDQLGGPAQAPESITWSVADESVASLDGTNGSSVNLIAHAEGATTVAVTVGSLTTILHVTIVPMVASAVSIDIGTPVAKAVAQLVPVEAHEGEHHAEAANEAEHAEESASPEHAESTTHEHAAHEEAAPVESAEGEAPRGEEAGRESTEHSAQPAHGDATPDDKTASEAA